MTNDKWKEIELEEGERLLVKLPGHSAEEPCRITISLDGLEAAITVPGDYGLIGLKEDVRGSGRSQGLKLVFLPVSKRFAT